MYDIYFYYDDLFILCIVMLHVTCIHILITMLDIVNN